MITNELYEQMKNDLMKLDTNDRKVFIELFFDEKVTSNDIKNYMQGNKILNKYSDIAEGLYILLSHERNK